MDSEEATYIWHTDRTKESLRIALREIEAILGGIKQNGRQTFLEKENANLVRSFMIIRMPRRDLLPGRGPLEEK